MVGGDFSGWSRLRVKFSHYPFGLGINFDLLLAPEPEALVRNSVIPSDEGDVDFTL